MQILTWERERERVRLYELCTLNSKKPLVLSYIYVCVSVCIYMYVFIAHTHRETEREKENGVKKWRKKGVGYCLGMRRGKKVSKMIHFSLLGFSCFLCTQFSISNKYTLYFYFFLAHAPLIFSTPKKKKPFKLIDFS